MKPAIIFDTSVWIQLIQHKSTPQALLLREYIAENQLLWLTPTILQEILQGTKSLQEFERLKTSLLSFKCLVLNPIEIAIESANLYRSLRQKGVTIRKANDCLIAAYAIHFNVEICHQDADFDLIAQNSSLKITQFT
ncbi:type II toxin-antitoxin system VapC family toxin [Arcicella lustrica]|uniref:PIN domain nuclease n=1 Tax=Arcicella lustrica TaxID=2984196 RepID=A0ABU5SE56_9BACT|nr:PIN domain nuclease [Arcicella sp. DC25W]MEA5425563.1 PIN domain nuclease [Arcicella sp. DC25W]